MHDLVWKPRAEVSSNFDAGKKSARTRIESTIDPTGARTSAMPAKLTTNKGNASDGSYHHRIIQWPEQWYGY